MNLAGYIRVSTEGQVDAYGKDVQRQAILTWATLNGHVITNFYEEDGVSGKTDGGERPVLSALLSQADSKLVDGMVCFDASRIARRLYVQETLLALVWAAGMRVFTTTAGEIEEDDDDPTRIMIRQILGVVAEFEHRSIVKKLHGARKVKAAQGGYIGGVVPFGKTVVGVGKDAQFIIDEVESEVIEKIRRYRQDGCSLRAIARSLNVSRIPTKMNKQWTPVQVSRILQRYETT